MQTSHSHSCKRGTHPCWVLVLLVLLVNNRDSTADEAPRRSFSLIPVALLNAVEKDKTLTSIFNEAFNITSKADSAINRVIDPKSDREHFTELFGGRIDIALPSNEPIPGVLKREAAALERAADAFLKLAEQLEAKGRKGLALEMREFADVARAFAALAREKKAQLEAKNQPPPGTESTGRTEAALTIPISDQADVSGLGRRRLERIGLEDVKINKPERPIIVALIDTGAQVRHPLLAGTFWTNSNEIAWNNKDDDGNGYVDDVHGFDFWLKVHVVADQHGHGTYSAGILAARPDKRSLPGLNSHVKLMVLKVTRPDGKATESAVAEAIRYAVNNGANILQISLCLKPRSKKVEEAVAWALSKNVLIIACANSHSEDTTNISPASSPGVITVGACDNEGKRAPFCGWGAHLDVVAPGVDVQGVRAWGTDFLAFMAGKDPRKEPSGGVIGQDSYIADGSCSALPQVTAVASLIWQQDPKLTAEQVRRKLLMGCDDLAEPGWDRSTGYGRINYKKALAADPDQFQEARVSGARVIRRGMATFVQVFGQADATHFRRRVLQIALGENPKDEDWQTVGWSQTRVKEVDGLLEEVPLSNFDKPGRWSIRCIVQDGKGQQRESRGTINRR